MQRQLLEQPALKYIWWERNAAEFSTPRLIAQIMDIGMYDDALDMLELLGVEPLRDVVMHAEPGWFRPQSWTYRHYELGIIEPGDEPRPLPWVSLQEVEMTAAAVGLSGQTTATLPRRGDSIAGLAAKLTSLEKTMDHKIDEILRVTAQIALQPANPGGRLRRRSF